MVFRQPKNCLAAAAIARKERGMKILAVDSNSIINRAYYAIRPLTTGDGRYTHAIMGFLNIFWKLLDDIKPDRVVFAFDLKGPTFRHQMYDGYKAQRKGMPNELAQQLEPLKEILTAMGYPIAAKQGYEADDVLGTIASNCMKSDDECVIATGDRDSFQLIKDGVSVCLAYTRGGQSGAEILDVDAIIKRYGITPSQMLEVKALMGDASDNIPGVAGIGEKTAFELIAKFGTLEGVYENLNDASVKAGVRKKLQEGREVALLSRQLAKIDCDVPLEDNSCHLNKAPSDDARLFSLLQDLELKGAIARLGLKKPASSPAAEIKAHDALHVKCCVNDTAQFKILLSCERLYAIIDRSEKTPAVAVTDANTCLAIADGETALLWIGLLAKAKGELYLPESKEWYAYLYKNGIQIRPVSFDPALAGYLISPLSSDYKIASMCAGRQTASFSADIPDNLSPELFSAAGDAIHLSGLCACLLAEIQEKEMTQLLFDIEQPLSRVLAFMETAGFALDADGLRGYGKELDEDLSELTGRIYEAARQEFNINSPKQMGEILFEKLHLPTRRKTKSGWSTDAEVLESLRGEHPVIEDILTYRKLAKLKSTYVEGLMSKVAQDGRVHTIFRQTETRTGRISSTEPNLQNIPVRTERGSRLRRFFAAPPGFVLVDADYSQIELRVLAHMAQDKAMQEAFLTGKDIHTQTASQVFDMPEKFVTPAMRSAAKAVNFGIVYGIGAFSLAQDIGVTVAEADRYIKNYLSTYAGVKRYMEETVDAARKTGFVTTMFGRRRPLPELTAQNKNTRAFGERIAMNTPIQGTAADIIKAAMVRVFDRLLAENMKSRLILQVHDELLVEAPEEEAERAALILTEEMQKAAVLSVPLVAKAGIGKNWLEAK
jgi:DNA polymerase-1